MSKTAKTSQNLTKLMIFVIIRLRLFRSMLFTANPGRGKMQETTGRKQSGLMVRILSGTKDDHFVKQPAKKGEEYVEPPFWLADGDAFEQKVREPLRTLGFNIGAHMLQFKHRVRREKAYLFLGDLREQLTPEQAAVFSDAFEDEALLQEIFGAPGRGTC